MLDPKKAAKLIRKHFEELTTEQFVENLRNLSHEAELEPKTKERQKARESESEILSIEKL